MDHAKFQFGERQSITMYKTTGWYVKLESGKSITHTPFQNKAEALKNFLSNLVVYTNKLKEYVDGQQ